MSSANQIFKDLKVLELASVLAGPSVGQFLAELGAEVIKVENPRTGGDVTRTWKVENEKSDEISAYFACTNWGKKSISLDISKPDGLATLNKLVAHTDVIIASFKPGDAEKLKVDYNSIKNIKPDIIYGEITGYGQENPRVGYDAIIQAESGFMYMNGQSGGPPTKMPVALIDILAGHQLKEGILTSYIHHLRTGEGQKVSVSLIQSAVASLANQATNWLMTGKEPTRKGSAHPNIAPYGDVFKTRDEVDILLAVGSDRQFNALCRILNIENDEHSAQYKTNIDRVINRDTLNIILKKAISQRSATELLKSLSENHIPAGSINRVSQGLDLNEVRQLRLDDGVKGVRNVAFHSDLSKPSHILPPPHFSQHTIDVLGANLGLTTSEIEHLISNKII